MKKLTLFLLLAPFVARAQHAAAPLVPIPMQNGRICYQSINFLQGFPKDSVNARAARWIASQFPETPNPLHPSTDGHLHGTGIFKVITSADGHYYWLQFAIDIAATDGGYSAQFSDYYEKPIEPGITNDWSKISYRWWDYRQGKPWSVEDQPLFVGLHQQSQELLASLQQAVTGH